MYEVFKIDDFLLEFCAYNYLDGGTVGMAHNSHICVCEAVEEVAELFEIFALFY